MICEQFIYGLFPDAGYKTVKTNGVDELLTKQSFNQLKALRLNHDEQETVIQMHFASEDLITVTYLKRTTDNYGRAGIINHTIIMRTSDYLSRFPPKHIVENYFIQTLNSPPNLKPIAIGE